MALDIEASGVVVPTIASFKNETGVIDTIVIACTPMRAAELIDKLEKRTGKTIISSNQSLCWTLFVWLSVRTTFKTGEPYFEPAFLRKSRIRI
ncbi:hypothetical protein AU476_20105 [Cupriavidus sp. UYMSc13B]|nr:hypothetical protein AU476_20105 [Cupriavidus sp. UYMSc13B]